MSTDFQTYVNDHLMADLPSGGKLSSAAIIGHDGGVFAQSPDFPEVSTDEMTSIMDGLDDPNRLAASGIRLGGTKYFLVPSEECDQLRGRHKSGGILIIIKTITVMIVGIYESGTAAEAEGLVLDMAEFLKSQGM